MIDMLVKRIRVSRRQEMFLLSPRNICVSLATNFVALKVSEVAKQDTLRGHVTYDNVAHDMSSSLARARP